MKYLVDTNVFLWYVSGSNLIPQEFINIIDNPNNEIFISCVTLWEIVIKQNIGKLNLTIDVFQEIEQFEDEGSLQILSLQKKHIITVRDLPFLHRDPFDRILFAQARSEKLRFLYTDKIFSEYEKNFSDIF